MIRTPQLEAIIDRYGRSTLRGALLPLLHELQREFGYIDPQAVPLIAHALNLSRAEVHGAISFYPDFHDRPRPRHVVKLCRAESCQSRGASAIETELSGKLGIAMGETRGDGAVGLEPVYCLGLCAIGPSAMVNDAPVARLDSAAVDRIVRALVP